MKKVLFLMLLFVVLGVANINSQVRIGGDGVPNEAVVLDLNATDAINNGTKGLALPRVNFSSNTAQITSGVANLTGMLVYNTNTTLGVGVYFWDAAKWVKLSDGSFVEVDGIVGNEVTNATTGGGLQRAGSGTAASPYTLGIANNGVTTGMIADHSITAKKLNTTVTVIPISLDPPAGSIQALAIPPGSSEENCILNVRANVYPIIVYWRSDHVWATRPVTCQAGCHTESVTLTCFN